jgi:RHS repeat-associated protein
MKKVKIGRNDACPCGSGIKYKNCCARGKKNQSFLRNPLFISVLVIFCLMTYSFAALLSSEDSHVSQAVPPEAANSSTAAVTNVAKDNSLNADRDAGHSARSVTARDDHTEEQSDANGGLYNLRARQYDPGTGRFLTPDSWEGDITRPATLNKYAYADGNPVNRTDPSGHFTIGEINTAHVIRNVLTDLQINTGMNLADAHSDPTGKSYVEDQKDALLVSAITGMAPRIFKLLDKRNKRNLLKIAGCFTAGTSVHTFRGLLHIEDIEPDDYVLAHNEMTGEWEWCRVIRTFIRHDRRILELRFEDDGGNIEKIRCTAEHPFGLKHYGWTAAKDLMPGDEIFTSSGGWVRVAGGIWLSRRQTVYNFEVEGLHNYFVGQTGVWVHNASKRKVDINPYSLPIRGTT